MPGDFDFISVGGDTSSIITSDSTTWAWTNGDESNVITCDPPIKMPYAETIRINIEDTETKLPEGVELMTLYDVYMVYAENRKNPEMKLSTGVIASNEEDAKIKSGFMKSIKEGWDADYLTFIVKCIGEVKVKAKPKEVKNV